jgi:hypothetical protein
MSHGRHVGSILSDDRDVIATAPETQTHKSSNSFDEPTTGADRKCVPLSTILVIIAQS